MLQTSVNEWPCVYACLRAFCKYEKNVAKYSVHGSNLKTLLLIIKDCLFIDCNWSNDDDVVAVAVAVVVVETDYAVGSLGGESIELNKPLVPPLPLPLSSLFIITIEDNLMIVYCLK